MLPLSDHVSPIEKAHWTGTAALVWVLLALLSLFPLAYWLDAALPLFTFLWLGFPLVVLLKTRCADRVGMRTIPWRMFARYGLANIAVLSLLMALFEPWSHTYGALLNQVFISDRPDLTFVWLSRFPGLWGMVGMFFFSGLVTLFGEELFFRGWLLQTLLKRMRPVWAIGLQALLFSIPQAIAALFLPPLQGVLYFVVYAWLSIGVTGGYFAWRTNSIWPGLAAAAWMNLVLTLLWSLNR